VAHLATARRAGPRRTVGTRLSPAPPRRPSSSRTEARLAAAIALLIAASWELLARLGLLSPTFFPPPSRIVATLVASCVDGTMPRHLAATVLRVGPGLLIGGAPGLLLGLVMGWSPRVRGVADPFIAALHPIPKLALLPLFMLIFGIGEASRIAAVAVAAFFPMLINAMAGVRQISPVYFEVAENYGARRMQVLTRVVLPGALPSALAGMRLAANIAFLVTIAVEIAAAQVGLGSLVWLSWQVLKVELLYATLAVIAVLGVALNGGMAMLSGWLVPWLPEREQAR
jgi:NitT/TauT family transport system permease protein